MKISVSVVVESDSVVDGTYAVLGAMRQQNVFIYAVESSVHYSEEEPVPPARESLVDNSLDSRTVQLPVMPGGAS